MELAQPGGPKAGVSNDTVFARKLWCGIWEIDLNADKESYQNKGKPNEQWTARANK